MSFRYHFSQKFLNLSLPVKAGLGKTAMLLCCLSVWGESKELCATFNTTTVGLERMAWLRNDCIMGIDERQIMGDNQAKMEKAIFEIMSGKGRIRGNKAGGIQLINSFNTVIMMTGENTFSTSTSTTGIHTRVIEVEGSPFDYNEELSSKMYELTSKHYGTAGRKFIEVLVDNYRENDYQGLKDKFEEIKGQISEKTENDISSYISAVSLITLADMLVSKEIFGKEEDEKAINMGLEILNKLPKDSDTDIVEKAYQDIKDWILVHHMYFETPKENEFDVNKGVSNKFNDINDVNDVEHCVTGKSYGLFENDIYYINLRVFKDWCEENHYSESVILKGWAEKEYIDTRTNYKNKVEYVIQKKIKGQNGRMVAVYADISDETKAERKIKAEKIEEQKKKEKERQLKLATSNSLIAQKQREREEEIKKKREVEDEIAVQKAIEKEEKQERWGNLIEMKMEEIKKEENTSIKEQAK